MIKKMSMVLALLVLLLPGQRVSSISAADEAAMVKMTTSAVGGTMLTDASGRSLYLFTRDERNKSNCTGACLQRWPALSTVGDPQAGEGVTANRLGAITRDDGSKQVTYNGWPLYYYANDEKPGDVKGQNVGGVWFVVSSYGGPRMNSAAVNVAASSDFGPILTDASGRVLYLYTRDEPNKTNCTGGCALVWPPLLTIGAPQAGAGASAGLLGFITREEGSTQVTYKGWPLYYYAPDEKPGDTKGQNVGGVWYVLSAAGEGVMEAMAPASLPKAGDSSAPIMASFAVIGAAALASGLLLRRRRAA